jgi:hypothetical protein
MNQYEQMIANDAAIQTSLKSGKWEPHDWNRYLALGQKARGEAINVPKANAGSMHTFTTQAPKSPVQQRVLNTPAEQLGIAEVPADVRAAQAAIGAERNQVFPGIPEVEAFGPGGDRSADIENELDGEPDLSAPEAVVASPSEPGSTIATPEASGPSKGQSRPGRAWSNRAP